ncbi:MAG: hypothetical protein WA994_06145 [Ornithinimicrobium sp.]
MTDPAVAVPSPQEPFDLQVESQAPTGEGPAHTEQMDRDRALNVLTRLLRAAYPHPTFPDGPYERTAGAVMSAAEADPGDYRSLLLGLRGLDVAAGGDFLGTDDDGAETLLRNVGNDSFFVRVRSTAVVALYDDAEVWGLLGYEGASFDQGGYLHRGFDDLDWLPPARIEEYTDEPRVQLVTENGNPS